MKLSRPVPNSGIGNCGPSTIKFGNDRSKKKEHEGIPLPVSQLTLAHFETDSSLSWKAFMAELLIFTARRGKISNIYSDNGTNFVGSNRELKEIYVSQYQPIT